MSDAADTDGAFPDPEDNPVIADPEFPVSRQGFSKRGPVILRGRHQAGFDRFPDALPHSSVDQRDVRK